MVSSHDITTISNNIIFSYTHITTFKYFNDLPQCAVPSAIISISLISFIFLSLSLYYNDTHKKKLKKKDI